MSAVDLRRMKQRLAVDLMAAKAVDVQIRRERNMEIRRQMDEQRRRKEAIWVRPHVTEHRLVPGRV